MKRIIFLFSILIVFYSCNKEEIIPIGAIEGKVRLDPEIDINNYVPYLATVWLEGTNITAQTDSSGNYKLVNVPKGDYNIKAQDYICDYWSCEYIEGKVFNVKVKGGETKDAPTITMTWYSGQSDYNAYLYNLKLQDENNSYSFNSYEEVVIHSNNVSVTGYARYTNNSYIDTLISIQVNDGDIQQTNSSKGWFTHDLTLTETKNEIEVWIGENQETSHLYSSAFIYVGEIQRVQINLDWSSDSYDVSAGDFDIHLINNNTNDSCWYNNPNPDWGIQDMDYDNPYLYDDINMYGYSYAEESLYINSTAEGSYTLNVHYFSNREDPLALVTPSVTLYLNSAYYNYTAPGAMSVGDYWTVTVFNSPFDNKMTTESKISYLSPAKLPKK